MTPVIEAMLLRKHARVLPKLASAMGAANAKHMLTTWVIIGVSMGFLVEILAAPWMQSDPRHFRQPNCSFFSCVFHAVDETLFVWR